MKRVVGLFSLLCILTACQGVRSVRIVVPVMTRGMTPYRVEDTLPALPGEKARRLT